MWLVGKNSNSKEAKVERRHQHKASCSITTQKMAKLKLYTVMPLGKKEKLPRSSFLASRFLPQLYLVYVDNFLVCPTKTIHSAIIYKYILAMFYLFQLETCFLISLNQKCLGKMNCGLAFSNLTQICVQTGLSKYFQLGVAHPAKLCCSTSSFLIVASWLNIFFLFYIFSLQFYHTEMNNTIWYECWKDYLHLIISICTRNQVP